MGFIKAIASANAGQLSDTFREVIKCTNNDRNVLVRKVTTENGVIQNESRLFVGPGQCAIYTDNGSIKDIITEPGMYFMDTSSPSIFQVNVFKGLTDTFLQSMKRIAYQGKEITDQAVYFMPLTEINNIRFITESDMLFKDESFGAMEIKLNGTYGFKITNPVNLLVNVAGNVDVYTIDLILGQINSYVTASLMEKLNKLEGSFDKIPSKINDETSEIIEKINSEIESLGIELTRIVVNEVNVSEEVRKAMEERTGIKMKATSVSSEEADIYTKLNTAEALKNLAKNPNGSATSIMGMNVGNTVAGVIDKNINNSNQSSQELEEKHLEESDIEENND